MDERDPFVYLIYPSKTVAFHSYVKCIVISCYIIYRKYRHADIASILSIYTLYRIIF
jgi:hypothetical protein